MNTKRITLATVKSFIGKADNLHIRNLSSFDGMTDCVTSCNSSGFRKATKTEAHTSNTLGVQGAWFVGGSRNSLLPFEKDGFRGIEVYNCCGHFVLAQPYLWKA